MIQTDGVLQRRRLRAPLEDGARLVEPPLSVASELPTHRIQQTAADYELNGRMMADVARSARAELLAAAQDYAGTRSAEPQPAANTPLVLTGTSTRTLPPGCLVQEFRRRQAGSPAQRACHPPSDRQRCGLPARPSVSPLVRSSGPRVEFVAFDRSAAPVPYEERAVMDLGLFRVLQPAD